MRSEVTSTFWFDLIIGGGLLTILAVVAGVYVHDSLAAAPEAQAAPAAAASASATP